MTLPDCRELIEFLDDYVADRLAPATRRAFDAHLEQCPACRNYLASYRQTMEMSKDARDADDASPPPMPRAVMRAILDAIEQNATDGPDAPG